MKRLFYGPEVIITFKTGTKLRVFTTLIDFESFINEFKDDGYSFSIRDCETDELHFVSKQHVLYIEVIREM